MYVCDLKKKLTERRELPRQARGLSDLKSNVRGLGTESAHTMRGLETYNAANSPDASIRGRNQQAFVSEKLPTFPNDRDLPGLSVPATAPRGKFGGRKVPVYVKAGFPAVLQSGFEGQATASGGSFLPKIPGAEENYGLVYNQPESEAEKNMHELWMARRRQEAFEWKTQQHLALVMDRLALHKSRLESDALR
eukprot:gene34796-42916_t